MFITFERSSTVAKTKEAVRSQSPQTDELKVLRLLQPSRTDDPNEINWEHLSLAYQNPSASLRRMALYQLLIIFCFAVGSVLILADLYLMSKMSAKYNNLFECLDIDNMFGADSTAYYLWAQEDFTFSQYSAMTGVYECFCRSKFAKNAPLLFCRGENVNEHKQILTGMVIGVVNNILFVIIQKCAGKIGFVSTINQTRFVMINIFIVAFINSSLT